MRHALLGLVLLLGAACGDAVSESGLPLVTLELAGARIEAELADRPEVRRRGLMHREQLAEDGGMVFVFPDERVRGFWMRNTTLPLSIAFADAAGRIVHIADLEPLSERNVSSREPALYALEMNRGWFRTRGVMVGDVIRGLPPRAAD